MKAIGHSGAEPPAWGAAKICDDTWLVGNDDHPQALSWATVFARVPPWTSGPPALNGRKICQSVPSPLHDIEITVTGYQEIDANGDPV